MKPKKLDWSRYQLADLLVAAVKSEIDSRDIYLRLGRKVRNAFLRERLAFLAQEEEKHRQSVEKIHHDLFPEQKLVIPVVAVVPLPEIKISNEEVPLSEVLQAAMNAEEIAYHFYRQLALRFDRDDEKKRLLLYFAAMEMGHYRLLEVEQQNAERFEEYGQEQEMIHLGP